MTNRIRCTACWLFFPPSRFSKNKRTANGFEYRCKECISEMGKARYEKRKKNKEFMDRKRATGRKYYYAHIERERENNRIYAASAQGQNIRKAYMKKWIKSKRGKISIRKRKFKYIKKVRARKAIGDAVRSGKVFKPDHCFQCESHKRIQAHHYLGYEKERHLNVIWLCTSCHAKLHRI